MSRTPIGFAVIALILAPMLSACVWVAAGGAVTGINAARQEGGIGTAIEDARIKAEIDSGLVGASADNFINVSVTVVEGRVLLTGRVAESEQRLDATRIAWRADGVTKVDNDIEVTDDVGWFDRPNDILIRTTVAAELLADPDIRDINYTVDCVNGVVYLIGVGQNRDEVERAIAHARGVSGVRRVENYVVLKDDPSRVHPPDRET